MAVVWGTVKDYKWYIDAQNTKGEGSAFKIGYSIASISSEEVALDFLKK